MPKVAFPVADIKSFSPAIDPREAADVYILDGKNFYWDSKGPKSGFGSRLISGVDTVEDAGPGAVCQSIDIGNNTFVFSTRGAYIFDEDLDEWTQVLDLSGRFPDVEAADDLKWTAAFLTKGIYFCHPVYGFYKKKVDLGVITLIPLDQDDIPGLPYGPVAIGETNGRLIVQGTKYWGWSGPNSAEDFSPELGGAGNQLIGDLLPGNSLTMAGFDNGFIGWTDKGCVVAEFIGGDQVFRFTRSTTEQLPINSHAVENLPDATLLICTKQGLFLINNGQEPQLQTPLFSEFIREFLEHETGIHVRLTYMLEENLLFVQIRDWTNHYVRTFVLSMSLDKWGIFSERHWGIIRWLPKRGAFGYVDISGVAHKFVEYTRSKQISASKYEGLDSNIEIGYLRPKNLIAEADTLQEIQEILLGGNKSRPSWIDVDTVTYDMGPMDSFQTITGVAIYYVIDCSFSPTSPDFTAYTDAIAAQILGLKDYIPAKRVDIGVIGYHGTYFTKLEKLDCSSADVDTVSAFVAALTQDLGGDIVAPFAAVRTFFDASLLIPEISKRNIVFVTDSVSDDGMSTVAASNGTAYDLINKTGDYADKSVDIWGIRVGSSGGTQYIGLLDNTPQDGIPVYTATSDEFSVALKVMLGIYEITGTGFDFLGTGWGTDESGDVDLQPEYGLLNHLTYNISVACDLDGLYDELVIEPELAVEKPGSNLYTLLSSGFFHRLRIEAKDVDQYYHIRMLETTFYYQGQLS